MRDFLWLIFHPLWNSNNMFFTYRKKWANFKSITGFTRDSNTKCKYPLGYSLSFYWSIKIYRKWLRGRNEVVTSIYLNCRVYILTILKRFVWQLRTPNRHVTETVLEISIITISRLYITFSASSLYMGCKHPKLAWEISKFQCTNPQEGRANAWSVSKDTGDRTTILRHPSSNRARNSLWKNFNPWWITEEWPLSFTRMCESGNACLVF